jgi:hypothetical protein
MTREKNKSNGQYPMQTSLSFLQSSALANDLAIVARRHGKTVQGYLKARVVEAMMTDLVADALALNDFSSEKKIDSALQRFDKLSDELIRSIARFRYDAARRRQARKLRHANTEGRLTAGQKHILKVLATKEDDLAIAKTMAQIEAVRRALSTRHRPSKAFRSSRTK